MKTSKIFQSPLWKSSFFVYGLVAMGFSFLAFPMHSETEVPNIDELEAFTGVISEIEEWRIKNHSGYNLSLKLHEGSREFGITRCEYPLNLGQGPKQLISPGDIVTVLVVNDGVWQVEKNGVLVCPYERVVKIQIQTDQLNIKLAAFVFVLGFLSSMIGIIRTRRGGCPSKA
uniref:Uncharacterized protein n=1 Tax=Candidatus Kentrum sp. LFY TaxID=2126342 RepID=A0A450WDX0_9GAMM|nr:MAG: hypothetical protein BECKLFY1418C_GA0070996_101348 [Candidatus Kentron sp. LFY]